MEEEKLRILKLVEHWVMHNDEHTQRFREVALEAKGMGLDEISRCLEAAAEKGDQVSGSLREAIEGFKR